MGADPFQLDTENLCPHLQEMINIKRVASDAFEIKSTQNAIFPLQSISKSIKAAEITVSLP
jgi:hypothetical protein